MGTFTQGEGGIATFELQQADVEVEADRAVPTAVDAEPLQPLDAGGPHISEVQQSYLQDLFHKYKDIFAYTPHQFGRTGAVKHVTDTGTHSPVRHFT